MAVKAISARSDQFARRFRENHDRLYTEGKRGGELFEEDKKAVHQQLEAEYPQLIRRLELTDRGEDREFIGEQIEEYRRVTSGG